MFHSVHNVFFSNEVTDIKDRYKSFMGQIKLDYHVCKRLGVVEKT